MADEQWRMISRAAPETERPRSKASGKKPTPTAAIIDSQSVRTAEGGEFRGYDGAKKINGRKRHIAVDTLGMLMVVVVHSAGLQDYESGHFVLHQIRETYWRLQVVFADSAYNRCGLPAWARKTCRVILQTALRPVQAKGFVVLPKRWIVERTFAWINRHRRLSKDYERLTENSETALYIAMIDLMSKRLAITTASCRIQFYQLPLHRTEAEPNDSILQARNRTTPPGFQSPP